MSFRLNFDVSLNFPPPPARSQTPLLASDRMRNDSAEGINKGLPGWVQTARLHPRYSLRLLYLLTAIAGIILANLIVGNFSYSWSNVEIHRTALAPLSIGFFWQLVTLYDKRLFHGRQIPNWAIAIVETLGFLAFLALFVVDRLELSDVPNYGSSFASSEMMLIAYDSAVWIVLCLVHGILAFQCYMQGWRTVRPKRAGCSDCEHGHDKGKGRAADDDEALLGGEEVGSGEAEAGSSEQVTPTPYRDEVERNETS
ncbi:MAG: hypothetical protein Q9221_003190 [Calogaya cf. arnoldii]